jgi:hypothetical protein
MFQPMLWMPLCLLVVRSQQLRTWMAFVLHRRAKLAMQVCDRDLALCSMKKT